MRTYGAKGYLVNTYSSQAFSKIAGDNLNTRQGALLTIDENGFLQLAGPNDIIEGISQTSRVFPNNNVITDQLKCDYQPALWENTYKMEVVNGTASQFSVGKFYCIDTDQRVDYTTESPSVGQLRVENIFEAGNIVEVRFIPVTGLPVPTYQDIHLESITENADTAGAYDFNLNNGNKITKALPDPTRVPLSDGENKVYGTDGEGNQTTYDIETAENKENAIAVRNAEGKLESDTPTANIEVTNKGYVDGVKTELEKDIEDTKKEVKDYVDDNFVKFTDGTPATKTRDIDLTDERNIILGDNSKLLGKDSAGSAHVLAEMATYEISSQEYDQIEIGSESTHLNLNTNNDANFGVHITVDTPSGKKQLAYTDDTSKRFVETITPTPNVGYVVNHNLNLERPIVQVYDAFNTQDTEVEISKMDSNNVTIKSTSSEPLVVVII